jgi:hypothetical protein
MSKVDVKVDYPIVGLAMKLAIIRFFTTTAYYNSCLNKELHKLDKGSLAYYFHLLIPCIKLTASNSKKYRDCSYETNALLNKFTILRPYYQEVHLLVKEHRKKQGLAV